MAIPWHRIFGMALTQYFAGTAWRVDVEVDLSLQQQRLDVVILRRHGHSTPPVWPDGFGTPTEYNLLTFKALKDPLDAWTVKELAAHGVNYRKQISPNADQLLPEAHFRLLAASMHYPRQLASQVTLQPHGLGAYDVQWGTDTIRVLVLREMPEAEQNVVWNLFSGDAARVAAALDRIRPQLPSWSSTLNELLGYYGLEGIAMPYTMEQFERDVAEKLLKKMTPEQLLKQLTPEQLLSKLTVKEILQSFPHKQLLSELPIEEIEQYLQERKAAPNGDAAATSDNGGKS